MNTADTPRWIVRGTPAYRRVTLALFLAGFSTLSLLYCVQPLLPLFATTFGVSPAASSLALSLSTVLLALAILCAGALSETLGRKPLMLVSLFASASLNLATAFAPDWGSLLALRALEGIALGGVPAVAMAYLADEIEPGGLGLAVGVYVGGTAFGGMVGRVGSGLLADYASWHWAVGVVGAFGLLSAGAFALLMPAARRPPAGAGLGLGFHLRAWGRHLGRPGLPWLFAVGFFAMGGFVTSYNYVGFHLAAAPYGLSQAAAGLIFTVYLFGMAGSSGAGGLADRIGRGPVMTGSISLALVGLLLTLAGPLALVIAGIALMTLGYFATHAVASSWVGPLADEARGHAAALYLLAYYLGSSLMGTLGGWFWAWGHWPAVVGFVGAQFAVVLAIAIRLHRA
ncbi:MFS transporter [Oleomonas cavernae]|uniref:MFS transporter n=1 Tax=Oleomonas cavernae TaxID=2320859 RepID=A0A418WEU8_9PROT|nr:MFS transporter [Oleomonas cavernae]RJF88527.1 MFS transporter [Oleomonas cavernae]